MAEVVIPSSAAPAAVPAAPASGLKSTELYVIMLALGALIYALQALIADLPALAALPGMPTWLVAVAAAAPVFLGLLVTFLAREYASFRTQLKLGTSAAATAGAAAAVNPGPTLGA